MAFSTPQLRWLSITELVECLERAKTQPEWISDSVVQCPPSGTILLFPRESTRFRVDGHQWVRRKDGKATREDHVRLRVNGLPRVYGCYARALPPSTLCRRCYWLLDSPEIVLVHYLASPDAANVEVNVDAVSQFPDDQAHASSYAPAENSLDGFEEMPFSFGDEQSPDHSLREFRELDWTQSDDLDENESTPLYFSLGGAPTFEGAYGPPPKWEAWEVTATTIPAASAANIATDGELLSPQFVSSETTGREIHWPLDVDVCPAWLPAAISEGSSDSLLLPAPRVVLMADWEQLPVSRWMCVFGVTLVPAHLVRPGVLVCEPPPHPPGPIELLVLGDGHPVTREVIFHFLAVGNLLPSSPQAPPSSGTGSVLAGPTTTSGLSLSNVTWADFVDRKFASLSLNDAAAPEERPPDRRLQYRAARTIQHAFRHYLSSDARRKKETAALLIQTSYRRYRRLATQREVTPAQGAADMAAADASVNSPRRHLMEVWGGQRSVVVVHHVHRVTQTQEEAALRIQTKFRGYREHRRFRRSKDAAVLIQRRFRDKSLEKSSRKRGSAEAAATAAAAAAANDNDDDDDDDDDENLTATERLAALTIVRFLRKHADAKSRGNPTGGAQ